MLRSGGEASVKAMLQTCIASISTIPENLDTAKPEKPLSAVRLYDRSNGNQKAWQDLSPEEKKKWESESEVLQKSFLYLEKSWKERRQVQEKHFEKVREIVDRRISRGLVAADISTLMSMLVGCPTTRVRAYFTRDERVETGKAKADSFPDEEYKWKFVKYSLQRGFESLSAVAFAMTAAHPDFWAVFVFDLVAGLPVEVQAQSRKNADGNFTFTTVAGFWSSILPLSRWDRISLGESFWNERLHFLSYFKASKPRLVLSWQWASGSAWQRSWKLLLTSGCAC